MEDNFYQVSTERLIKPTKRQRKKVQQDKNAYEHERPLITAVMERLEKDIEKLEKIDSIKSLSNPEEFMREVAVNKEVCAVLRRELSVIKNKVKMFDAKKL